MRNTTHLPLSEALEARLHLAVSRPHLGHPFPVGQVISAVDFDDGGADVSYHITTAAPAHPLYRKSPATIAKQKGKYLLTHLAPGEWFNYTVQIPSAGLYGFTANLRAPAGSSYTFHIELDGTQVSYNLPIPTGRIPAQEYDLELPKGKHILRVVLDPSSQGGATIGPFSTFQLFPSPLDASFGTDGVATDLLGSNAGQAQAAAIANDGKIFVSASTSTGNLLLRLNTDGSLDTTFGDQGVAQAPVAGPVDFEPNGDIILAGLADPTSRTSDYVIARFHSDGTLDDTFGASGTVTAPQYGTQIAMGVLSNGNIVVASSQGVYRNTHLLLRGYTPEGGNTSYGSTFYPTYNELDDKVLALRVLPGDRVNIAAQTVGLVSSDANSEQDTAYLTTIQANQNGYEDSYDMQPVGNGSSCCPETDEYLTSAYIRPDGKLASSSYSTLKDESGLVVAVVQGRKTFQVIDPAGNNLSTPPDYAYGIAGVSKFAKAVPPFDDPSVSSLLLQGDGKLLVLGSSGGNIAIARFSTPNGPDTYAYTPPTQSPLTIQAENFDTGGEGTAYHDADAANQGALYRAAGVDIGDNGQDGLAVGWTQPGEWLNYTVNTPKTGNYRLSVRAASSGKGGSLHFTAGSASTGAINIPDTGGWTTWKSLSGRPLRLTKGMHTIRLHLDAAGPAGSIGNIDSFTLRPA